MRIDEIDLYGNLLISGSTGGSGQVISYSGSNLSWATASSTPSTSDIDKRSYNSIIVETVNNNDPVADAITNGDRLLDAYAQAKLMNVGGLSVNNRISLLLMPGEYDVSTTSFQLDTSYIDIVGMSTFAGHTVLKSSTNAYTITYQQNVDSRLENIDLRVGTTGGVYDNGDSGQYLRWKNVIVNGNCFYGTGYHFDSVNGEFEDIIVKDSANFVSAQNNIDGIYKNINFLGNVGPSNFVSSAGSISGTYSNLNFSILTSAIFSATLNLSVYINGFRVVNGTSQNVFYGQNVYGTYKNIFVNGCYGLMIANTDLICTIENLTLVAGTGDFCTANNLLDSTSKNLYIDNPSNNGFYSTTSILSGTFSNIKFNDFTNLFVSGATTSGHFENIQAGFGVNFFNSSGGSLSGTFKDIEVESVTTNSFYTNGGDINGYFENIELRDTEINTFTTEQVSGRIVGTFKNIKLLSVAGNVLQSYDDLDGTFENIEITDNGTILSYVLSSYGNGSILGKYKDISVSRTTYLFNAQGGDIDGDFENITFGDINYASSTAKVFYSSGNLLGKYKNISTLSPQNSVFEAGNNIDIQVENISLVGVDKCFVALNNLKGTYKNTRIGNILNPPSGSFMGSDIDIVVDDFLIGTGDNSWSLFESGDFLIGTFSNIEVGSGFNNVFVNTSSTFNGTFKNIRIGDCSGDIFSGGNFSGVNSYIDNLISVDRFSTQFGGTIRNSKFGDGSSGWAFDIIAANTVVENCEISGVVPGPPDYTIFSSLGGSINAYISYTHLSGNGGIQVASITNLLNPSYNVGDDNQTWPT